MTTKTLTCATLATLLAASLLSSARADIVTGLTGYWNLDEGSGSTAADSSTNVPANNGTLTQFADTGFTTMWTNGWFNSALIFNQNGETTNYVSIPNSTSLNTPTVNKAWTVAAWVKCSVAGNSEPANAGILCKGNLNREAYSLYMSGGKFTANQRNAAGTVGQSVSSTFAPAANTWYHVAASFTTAGGTSKIQMVMYINGTNNANGPQNTYTTAYSTNLPVTIGCRADANGLMTLPFKGTIDDVRIYNRKLSSDDVFQLYTNSAPGSAHLPVIATQPRDVRCYSNDTPVFAVGMATTNSYAPLSYQWQFGGAGISGATAASLTLSNVTAANEGAYTVVVSNYAGAVTSAPAQLAVQSLPVADAATGLAAWWKFDDASGSASAADASGNGNAGALTGFADTGFTSMWGDGILGGALSFNGDGSGSDVVAVPGLGTPAPAALDFSASPVFSLSAWVRASLTQSNEAAILAKGTGGGGEQYVLEISTGNYRFFVRDTNGVAVNINSAVPFNGFWQHVVAVVNATNGIMNLYVNGALAGSAVAPFSLLANSHELSIGNRQASTAGYADAFSGAIDDVRVYNRDLTSADVYALYSMAAFPIITAQYPATGTNLLTLYAGASPSFRLATVTGALPFSYQWYTNDVSDPAGTNSTYQLHNLAVGNITNYCVVTNSIGAATSFVWAASVVAAPAAPYPQVVLADNPLGYWRLNETPDNGSGNNGVPANDYWNGNLGLYSNTSLAQDGYSRALSNQFGYYPATEPALTSAQFGYYPYLPGSSNYVGGIQGIDFSTPTNHTGNFSVEAWVKGDVSQSYNAGIVAKGAWGSEQFTLDTGGTNYSYRFTLRDAGKQAKYVSSNTNAPDGNWHHLVGVLDEANSNACLYVDGVKVASVACSPSNGVYSTAVPVSLGTRLGSSGKYDQQFFGNLNDVAVYNHALSSIQVANHYLAAGFPPAITQNPVSFTNVNEGTTLVVPAKGGGGTAPMSVQWYDVTLGNPGTPVADQTNVTLVISNVSAALYNNHVFALSLSNSYGHPYSSSVYVTINSGVPIVAVAPAAVTVYAGKAVVFKAAAQGTEPFSYQWSVNGSAVAGATDMAYTNTAGVGARSIGCTATGPGGSGSGSATLTGLAAPSDSYASLVLADQPVAYWRLDEAVNATVANDYAGGHNANYSLAVNGLPGFGSANPDTAAGFGMNGATSGSMALEQANSGVQLVDFSAMGTNASFSVEAWVKAPNGQSNGGIVAKGWGHAEQFVLDAYGNSFRFYGRDPSNATHGPTSTVHPDGLWHHLVGVYDGANGLVNLFVDGTVQGSATMTPGLGVLATPVPTSIGARTSSSTDTGYSLQLSNAMVDEVAMYPYALTTNQVAQHYATAAMPPQLVRDLQPQLYAYAGFPLSLSVSASSTTAMTYQWQRNGLNLTDGASISGANSNVLTLSPGEFAAGNTFQAFVTNQATPIAAASTRATLTILPQLGFNGFGNGWSSQGSAAGLPFFVGSNALELTDGTASKASSSFFGYPVYVGGFQATFTYQAGGNKAADGTAFVIQNDSRGAAALGVGGGGMGYSGITNSLALELNLYTSRGVGCTFATNGVTGGPYASTTPLSLNSGNPIDVTVLYANGVISLSMTDAVAQTSFALSTNMDIPAVVGADSAYVGFSGASGSVTAIQVVSNFTFVSLPALSIQATTANQVVVTWPAAAGGAFALQQSSTLGSGWTTVGVAAARVGDLYQVTLAVPAGSNTFYRLVNSL